MLVHRYGPHIFHTASAKVVDYLSQFTSWRPYEHRVVAQIEDRLVPLPINRTTVNTFFGLDREPMRRSQRSAPVKRSRSRSRGRARTRSSPRSGGSSTRRSSVGTRASSGGATRQSSTHRCVAGWRSGPTPMIAISATGTSRCQPTGTRRCSNACSASPGSRCGPASITTRSARRSNPRILVYTGPIDQFFGYEYGPLPYRSLEFELRNLPTADGGLIQPAGSINFPSEDVPYTRITEYRHLTGQRHPFIHAGSYEYPRTEGDPLLPGAQRREPGAVQALRGAGGGVTGRDVRRPAGSIPVPQYGSGGRRRPWLRCAAVPGTRAEPDAPARA